MSRKINFFDGVTTATPPVLGNLVASNLVQYANDAAYEAAEAGAPAEANIYYNTTIDQIRYYADGAWHTLIDHDQTQEVENKTVDGTDAGGKGNVVTCDADDVVFDPTASSLTAVEMQGVGDEVAGRIDDLEALSGAPNDTDYGTFSGSTIGDNQNDKECMQDLETAVEARIPSSEKGAANGVATLDGSGKIPSGQMPVSAMQLLGAWDANTNSPTLADGVGTQGDTYRVSVAGSQDLGSGSITFDINDWIYYNGSVWFKSDNIDQVTSVAGKTGVVTLDSGDVGLGNVDNTSDATKDAAATNLENKTITSPVINTSVSGTAILDEDDLSSDSDTQLATQQSIKAYVDSISGGNGGSSRNYAQNAQFRFFQRQNAASLTARANDAYGPDRWYILNSGGNSGTNRQTDAGGDFRSRYACLLKNNDASARRFGLASILSTDNCINLRGKEVTMSMVFRSNATDISNVRFGLVEWTGSADAVTSDIISSWAATPTLIGSATFINTPGDLAITSTYAKFSTTVTLGTTFNNLILFAWTPATEAQNDTFFIKEVQLVEGDSSPDFSVVAKSRAQDYTECTEYLEKSYGIDVAPGTNTAAGLLTHRNSANATNVVYAPIHFSTRKRAIPTMTYYTPTGTSGKARMHDSITDPDVTASAVQNGERNTVLGYTGGSPAHGLSWHFVAESEL